MSTLKLIELVRKARVKNYSWIAVDSNGDCFSYMTMPDCIEFNGNWYALDDSHIFIGEYNLSCSWKDTLIDVNKILVK